MGPGSTGAIACRKCWTLLSDEIQTCLDVARLKLDKVKTTSRLLNELDVVHWTTCHDLNTTDFLREQQKGFVKHVAADMKFTVATRK